MKNRKKLALTLLTLTVAAVLALSASAAVVKTISAQLRPDITVVVDGVTQEVMTDVNGSRVYPLSYEGTVYLPIRALGSALSHEASWNSSTKTITLTPQPRQPGFDSVTGAETTMTKMEKDIAALTPAATYEGRARQYAEGSVRLENFRMDLGRVYAQIDEDYRMGRTTQETYRALTQRLDQVSARLTTARTDLERKTIADTSADRPTGSGSNQSYTDDIAALQKRADQLSKDVHNYKPAQGQQNNKQAHLQLARKLQELDREIDQLDDRMEQSYRAGKLSAADYRTLDRALEQAEHTADTAADYLEDVLHFDDDWDDDDRYDDDWYDYDD